MILFTKPGCTNCAMIKKRFNLDALGIKEIVLSEENADALAELAWYELVEEAKDQLPILLLEGLLWGEFGEGHYINDIPKIIGYLSGEETIFKSINKSHNTEAYNFVGVKLDSIPLVVCTKGQKK